MDELAVKEAAINVLGAWAKGETASTNIHPQLRLLLGDSGTIISKLTPTQEFSVEHIQILSVGLKNAAQAKIATADNIAGFLVFLHVDGRWQCISGAFGTKIPVPITPKDTMDVTSMVWDGYCDANASCRGDLMAKVFHNQCRLTFVDETDSLRVMDQKTFCEMVTNRYAMEAHKEFAHLKDSVAEKSTLISIDFATPNVAMVILKVGHPPFLWSDLLTCMKIDSQWWIVHKSSCHEDFFRDGEEGPGK